MSSNNSRFTLAALLIGACFLPGATARAQVPPNDTCATAITIGDGITSGTNVNATIGPDPVASCVCCPSNDVWYAYSATCSGNLRITFCPPGTANFSAVLTFWSGTCGALQQVACSSLSAFYSCGLAELMVSIVAGTQYYISVDGNTEIGTFTLSLTSCFQPPPGDGCVNAIQITEGIQVTGSTMNASAGPEPVGSCITNGGPEDVWYRIVPVCGGVHYVTPSCAAIGPTGEQPHVMTLFDGSGGCGNLVELACFWNFCGMGLMPHFTWTATAGTPYYISVATGTNTGPFTLIVTPGPPGTVMTIGTGCTSGGGAGPSLSLSGPPTLGATLAISITGAPPSSAGAVWISAPTDVVYPLPNGCVHHLDPLTAFFYRNFNTDANGNHTFTDMVPNNPSLSCLTVRMGSYVVPPGGNPFATYAVTNALQLTL